MISERDRLLNCARALLETEEEYRQARKEDGSEYGVRSAMAWHKYSRATMALRHAVDDYTDPEKIESGFSCPCTACAVIGFGLDELAD
jgi:hypothetical protein